MENLDNDTHTGSDKTVGPFAFQTQSKFPIHAKPNTGASAAFQEHLAKRRLDSSANVAHTDNAVGGNASAMASQPENGIVCSENKGGSAPRRDASYFKNLNDFNLAMWVGLERQATRDWHALTTASEAHVAIRYKCYFLRLHTCYKIMPSAYYLQLPFAKLYTCYEIMPSAYINYSCHMQSSSWPSSWRLDSVASLLIRLPNKHPQVEESSNLIGIFGKWTQVCWIS